MLGFDEKELEIIPKPALSNFDIYKVVVNEEDFLKSILPYEGEVKKSSKIGLLRMWLIGFICCAMTKKMMNLYKIKVSGTLLFVRCLRVGL